MREKQEGIEEKQKEIKREESEKRQAIKDGEAAEKELVKVTKKRDAEMTKGGRLKQLQDEASELGKVVAKIRTQAEIKVTTIKDEEARIRNFEARIKEVCVTVWYSFRLLTTISARRLSDRKAKRGRRSYCSTSESQRRTYRFRH